MFKETKFIYRDGNHLESSGENSEDSEIGNIAGSLKEQLDRAEKDDFEPKQKTELSGTPEVTFDDAIEILETAAKENQQRAYVAGKEITNPQKALDNLRTTLRYVKNQFNVSRDDLKFTTFEGDIVSEATPEGAKIDVIMLMHPAVRMVHAVFHELLHEGGKVSDEALVESRTKQLLKDAGLGEGDDLEVTKEYQKAIDNLEEFVNRCSGNESTQTTLRKIYDYYYAGDFNSIYELYYENYITEFHVKEQDEAFGFFEKTFPELEIRSEDGNFHLVEEMDENFGYGEVTSEKDSDNPEL